MGSSTRLSERSYPRLRKFALEASRRGHKQGFADATRRFEQELGARDEKTPDERHGLDQPNKHAGREGGDRTASPKHTRGEEMER